MKFLLEKGGSVEIVLVSNNIHPTEKGRELLDFLKEKELSKESLMKSIVIYHQKERISYYLA